MPPSSPARLPTTSTTSSQVWSALRIWFCRCFTAHSAPIHRRGEFRRQSWDSVHTAVAHAESVWSCKTDAKHALDDGCQRGVSSAPGHAKLHSVSDHAAADLPPVAVEAGTLQLILGNILDNAVEASPQRGSSGWKLRSIQLSESEARDYLGQVSAGPYVLVRISDEGPVIRDEYRRKMFVEPFFTTKVRHRGLGLSIVYRVLSAHRGGARVEAVSDRGTATRLHRLTACRPHSRFCSYWTKSSSLPRRQKHHEFAACR